MADILEFPGRGAFSPEGRVDSIRSRICTNCGEDVGDAARCFRRDGKQFDTYLCTKCGGYVDALAIGAGADALFLYEGSAGAVTSWGSAVLGTVVNKTMPPRRSFQPVRFKVRMLDGSMWYGTGPSSCGNYIRLRRMKGDR